VVDEPYRKFQRRKMKLISIKDRSNQIVWVNIDKLVSIRKTRDYIEVQFDNSPSILSSDSVDDIVKVIQSVASQSGCTCK